LSIQKVKALIKDKRIKHFPGDVPNAVILVLVDEFASTWPDISSKWFEDIEELSRGFMQWLLEMYFSSHRNTGLYDEVK
jgi:hypothetical protein